METSGNGMEGSSQGSASIANMIAHYDGVVNFINGDMDPSNRLNKLSKQELLSQLSKWAIYQAELLGQHRVLVEENERLRKEVARGASTPIMSYASVASKNVGGSGGRMTQIVEKTKKSCTLFVSGKGKETAKEIQAAFTKNINPAKDKIKIKSIRTTNKMLVVGTESESDMNKLKTNTKLNGVLKVELAKKKKPMVIFYDTPSDMKENDLKEAIYEQNLSEETKRKLSSRNLQ